MTSTFFINFARKPEGIKEVQAIAQTSIGRHQTVVAETKELTTLEYDIFISNFLRDRDWLKGKGGFKNDICQAIEVTAPERDTLYVDPSGYSYARYVGIKPLSEEV